MPEIPLPLQQTKGELCAGINEGYTVPFALEHRLLFSS